MAFCLHVSVMALSVSSVEIKKKKLQSLAPESSVFLYAGLGSLPAVVISKELKAYKSHVRVIMYILSASAFTDPQTVCVCVCVVIRQSYSGIRLLSIISLFGFCEPERRNEHPEFIGH